MQSQRHQTERIIVFDDYCYRHSKQSDGVQVYEGIPKECSECKLYYSLHKFTRYD